MASIFDVLPAELIGQIAEELNLNSLASARLASRNLKRIFTASFLARFFGADYKPTFDLTARGLAKLQGMASSPDFRPLLCTSTVSLNCLHYQEAEEVEEQEDVGRHEARQEDAMSGIQMYVALREAFHHLREVTEIALDAIVVLSPGGQRSRPERVRERAWRGRAWRRFWAKAIQSYRVVMSAICQSQISVRNLVIFYNTKLCGIPTNEVDLTPWLGREGYQQTVSCIRNLSISVSSIIAPVRPKPSHSVSALDSRFFDPFDISAGEGLSAADPEIDTNADFQGFAQFLASMPNLESLSIHFYRMWKDNTGWFNSHIPYKPFLPTLLRTATFPRLNSLTLKGLPISPDDIRELVARWSSLQSLTLRNMLLTAGLWDRALEPIMRLPGPPLKRLHLSNLWRLPGFKADNIGAQDGNFLKCTNLESPSRKLTVQDFQGLSDGTASEERRQYGNDEVFKWHTLELGEEELRTGQLDIDASTSGGMPYGNPSDYRWRLNVAIEWGPPRGWLRKRIRTDASRS